jgi:DNA polymerase-3 subunit delta'
MIYPWLQPALDQWHQQLAANRQPQAMIIEGNPGIGKSTMTQAIVAELLCRKPNPEPCGHCQSCRIFKSGQHPDLMSVVSEKSLIKVAAIRSLVQFYTATAHSAPHKVAVIERADTMNTAAANALLKVLEEPPAGSLLILQTDRIHHLLPTIRSRCVHFKLHCQPAQYVAVKQWLQQQYTNLSADKLERLWVLSPGLPLSIKSMIDEDVASQLESHLNQILDYLTNQQSLVSVSQYLEQHVEQTHWPLLQAIFLHWLKANNDSQQAQINWPHGLQHWLCKQDSGNLLMLNLCQLINTIMVNLNNQTKTRLLIESMLVQIKQTDA